MNTYTYSGKVYKMQLLLLLFLLFGLLGSMGRSGGLFSSQNRKIICDRFVGKHFLNYREMAPLNTSFNSKQKEKISKIYHYRPWLKQSLGKVMALTGGIPPHNTFPARRINTAVEMPGTDPAVTRWLSTH